MIQVHDKPGLVAAVRDNAGATWAACRPFSIQWGAHVWHWPAGLHARHAVGVIRAIHITPAGAFGSGPKPHIAC